MKSFIAVLAVAALACAFACAATAMGLAPATVAHAGGRADLVESRLGDPPSRLAAGRSFKLTDVVTNRGAANARRSVARYYLTRAKTVLLVGSRHVPALGADARSRGRTRLSIRAGAPAGRYSLVACADATRRIRERDERNNCRVARRRIAVPGPGGVIPKSPGSSTLSTSRDSDRDGYPDGIDCAPRDAAIHPGAIDRPDLGFVDANCDGIDGDATRAVFASPKGNDASPGTMTAPLRTLAAAVAAADAGDKDVYAAAGTFGEELRMASRVSVYGGYTSTWRRSLTAATVIAGAFTASYDTESALALNVTAPTTLQLVTLKPVAAVAQGSSSYGLRAVHSPGLRIEHATVIVGPGVRGSAGNPGTDGAAGGDGGSGDAQDLGRGGTSPVGHVGGKGGFAGASEGYGYNGAPGWLLTPDQFGLKGGAGGAGGVGGSDHTAGERGQNGDIGTFVDNGGLGARRGDATAGSGLWHGYDGNDGGPGRDGHGGGGGGGGGSDDDGLGGEGGGGGGGGQAGGGGHGGHPGGGSFGLFLVDSAGALVRDSSITASDGGIGGPGGDGGRGGAGGPGGGSGDAIEQPGSDGGAGGAGGAGSPGGNGGGGAGGPSAAIVGLTPAAVSETTLHHGAGGPGGGGDPTAAPGAAADYLADGP